MTQKKWFHSLETSLEKTKLNQKIEENHCEKKIKFAVNDSKKVASFP